jgi:hypothetical protein
MNKRHCLLLTPALPPISLLVVALKTNVTVESTDNNMLPVFNNSEIISPKKTRVVTVKDHLVIKYALSKAPCTSWGTSRPRMLFPS